MTFNDGTLEKVSGNFVPWLAGIGVFRMKKHYGHPLKFHEFSLWADLQSTEMDELLQIVTVKGFRSGEILFTPEDAPDFLYLLQHGRVKTFVYSPQGQEKIMHIFCPGDAFGGLLMGVVDDKLPWAQAIGDVVLCMMDEVAFKRFMQRCPNTCFGLFRYMSAHHVQDMRRIEHLLHTKASYRVVHALLELGHRLGLDHEEQFTVSPYFTHEDIGNMIGMARTTVSEIISDLRRCGVVGRQGRNLTVNRQAAEQFLHENA